MSSRYPIATTVFILLTLFTITLTSILFSQLLEEATETKQIILDGDRAKYAQKQEVANAFSNLVKAYQECIDESDCVCDIYRLKFSSKYKIKVENVGESIRLSLLDKYDNELIAETINNINTGLIENINNQRCTEGELYVKPESTSWYVQKEDSPEKYYFFDDVREIYKPDVTRACFVTENPSFENKPSDNLRRVPRCTFKKQKKEEQAFNEFKDFVEEFKACSRTDANCLCDFSRISIPDEYFIKIEQKERLVISLVKLKTRFDPGKELLQLEANIETLIEDTSSMRLQALKEACIVNKDDSLGFYPKCDMKAKPLDANELKAVFFDSGKKTGFLIKDDGLLNLGKDKGVINKAGLDYCYIDKKSIYSLEWPTEKLNDMYYVESCFGSEEGHCNNKINILQQSGKDIYAVESGIVESIDTKTRVMVLKHKQDLKSTYRNVLPISGVASRSAVTKGQKIGVIYGASRLDFSLIDEGIEPAVFSDEDICIEGEDEKSAILVEKSNQHYVNPGCYFTEEIRDNMVYTAKCEVPFRGCNVYGNEEEPKEKIRVKVLLIPVNWERQYSYMMFANDAIEKFLQIIPLKDCPAKFKRIFVDSKTDYGESWQDGSCKVQGRNNCYNYALQEIKICAEEYKDVTGQDYDFVVGIEDSNIAHWPDCNYDDRGWTAENSDAIIVEAQYPADVAHELGHKFDLKDQYCDCTGTEFSDMCGYGASPNPLKDILGCGEDCCTEPKIRYAYDPACKWCQGNLDINSKDTDGDKKLDDGKRTLMSNYMYADSYSIDEYLYLKTRPKLQCT